MTTYKPHSYVVGGRRYGYSAIDEYDADGKCLRTVIAGITKKEASIMAGALASAVYYALTELGFKYDESLKAYVKE